MTPALSALLISMAASTLLAGLQFYLSVISGSHAILADAWHSASDLVTTVLVLSAVLGGLHFEKKKGPRHPWLLHLENSTAVFISLAIMALAVSVVFRTLRPSPINPERIWLLIAASLFSMGVTFITAFYRVRVGRESGVALLTADGLHAWADLLSTAVCLLSLIGLACGINIDKPAAAVIAAIIFKTGFSVFLQTSAGAWLAAAAGKWRSRHPLPDSVQPFLRYAKPVFLKLKHKIPSPGHSLFEVLYGKSEAVVAHVKAHKRFWLSGFGAGALGLYLLSGLQSIPPASTGIIILFGRVTESAREPGLVYTWPRPFGRLTVVPTQSLHRMEIGFRTRPNPSRDNEPFAFMWENNVENTLWEENPQEGLLLTGDENFIICHVSVQYRILTPELFVFQVNGVEDMMRFSLLSSLNRLVNETAFDEMLLSARDRAESRLQAELQEVMTRFRTGVTVVQICLRDIHPPVETVGAFREVASAQEYRNQLTNEALGYGNEIIPAARGEAATMEIQAAQKALEARALALGQSERFLSREKAFRLSPAVSRERLTLETAERALEKMEKIIIKPGPKSFGSDLEKLLLYNKILKEDSTNARGKNP